MRMAHGAIPAQGLAIFAAAQHLMGREAFGVIDMTFLFQRLFARRITREDRELAYLNGSVSIYDLECREREIAAGKFASH